MDIAYIGRRGTHLLGAYNVNQTQIFTNGFLDAFNTVKAGGESALINNLLKADTRLNAGESGSQMLRRLFASNLTLNSVGALASSIATRLQNGVSVTQLSAGQPFVFIPYPQFTSLNVLDSNDFSTYHALEAQLTRRLSHGISFNIAYTWSKALDTRSFDPTLTVVGTGNASTAADTPFDINNRRLNYAYSDFDRRHVFQWNVVAELPFGKGKHFLNNASGLVDRVARRLGSHRLRPRHQRPSLLRLRRHQHGQQRQPVHRQLHGLRPRRRNGVHRGRFRPALVLRRRRARQVLRPRRRPVRQHRPQLLRRTALVRNRCVAVEARRP